MDLGLAGKVALVAGSSRGIGFSVAEAFLREGAKAVITGRGAARLASAHQTLADRFGADSVLAVAGDLTELTGVRRAIDEVLNRFGRLDAVVPNVGSGAAKAGFDISREDWTEILNSNLLGSTTLAGEALKHLTERGAGTLTFVSSIAGIEAVNAPLTYSAAKSALLMAMKNYARLVAGKGVRVNAVAPGNILFPGGSWEKKLKEKKEVFENYIRSEVPMQRFGRPDEIADAVVYLASERASFITGAVLVADGGQTRSFI